MTTPKTKTQKNKEYYSKSKSNVFSLRLSDETTELFNEMCSTTGKGKSELIRAILDGATIRTPNTKLTNDVLRELSAIGNNLNQLTHVANIASKEGLVNVGGLTDRITSIENLLKEMSAKL